MHTTPIKHPQQHAGSISHVFRQIMGWSIVYAGALIVVAQVLSHLL